MSQSEVPSGLTVTQAVATLRADGYAQDFSVSGDGLRCSGCGHVYGVSEVVTGSVMRVEGPSDPGDEAIVVGLECPSCGTRGVLVAGYGPTADPVEAGVILRLGDHRP
jgi:hypothetical protein